MIKKFFLNLTWWQMIIVSVIVSAIGGLSSFQSNTEDRRLYAEQLIQAPWSPPGWLFGPAWAFNNIFILLALQKILRQVISNRTLLLKLQGGIWFIFFSFGYVYFNKRSPVLAGIWTMADMVLATISIYIALKQDKKLAFYYLPLFIWTFFASTVAGYQLLKNPDPVFKTEAPLKT